MNGDNGFRYTYSAPDHQEVLRIRSKYLPAEESKLEELKRLDRTVQNSGTMESLIVGVTAKRSVELARRLDALENIWSDYDVYDKRTENV